MQNIIVTGGLGFIGSHTVVELLNNNYNVIILDNLSNSEIFILDRIIKITNKKPIFIQVDVKDYIKISKLLDKYKPIDGVFHFAAFKSVNESVANPLMYYDNNINSLISIIRLMENFKIEKLVYSSSCTVYGQPNILPVTENSPFIKAWSPYGHTKQICEEIINSYINSNPIIKVATLRYFNPVGAHESGLIGELPKGIPNNLMPYLTQTALGIREFVNVYGNDYNTKDGTPIRDYIHIVDLAISHLKAYEYISNLDKSSNEIFNIGTGKGYSVLEVINSLNKWLDKPIKFKIVARRPGDVEQIWADPTKANQTLNWYPKYNLDDMTKTALNWEKNFRKERNY
jgi:UDP-glucose 4-epimerase